MCFSIQWIAQLIIWAVVLAAIWAILNLIVPWALTQFGANPASSAVGMLMQIFKILIWAAVTIFIVIVVFDILSCLLGAGGGLRLGHG